MSRQPSVTRITSRIKASGNVTTSLTRHPPTTEGTQDSPRSYRTRLPAEPPPLGVDSYRAVRPRSTFHDSRQCDPIPGVSRTRSPERWIGASETPQFASRGHTEPVRADELLCAPCLAEYRFNKSKRTPVSTTDHYMATSSQRPSTAERSSMKMPAFSVIRKVSSHSKITGSIQRSSSRAPSRLSPPTTDHSKPTSRRGAIHVPREYSDFSERYRREAEAVPKLRERPRPYQERAEDALNDVKKWGEIEEESDLSSEYCSDWSEIERIPEFWEYCDVSPIKAFDEAVTSELSRRQEPVKDLVSPASRVADRSSDARSLLASRSSVTGIELERSLRFPRDTEFMEIVDKLVQAQQACHFDGAIRAAEAAAAAAPPELAEEAAAAGARNYQARFTEIKENLSVYRPLELIGYVGITKVCPKRGKEENKQQREQKS